MIRVRFPTPEAERRALGYLVGRFSFKTWAGGEMIVPAVALSFLAREGIRFQVEGLAAYEQRVPSVQTPPAPGQ
jgi:hypothetical protein